MVVPFDLANNADRGQLLDWTLGLGWGEGASPAVTFAEKIHKKMRDNWLNGYRRDAK